METVSTDRNDRPMVCKDEVLGVQNNLYLQEDITITGTTVFVDPYEELESKVRYQ